MIKVNNLSSKNAKMFFNMVKNGFLSRKENEIIRNYKNGEKRKLERHPYNNKLYYYISDDVTSFKIRCLTALGIMYLYETGLANDEKELELNIVYPNDGNWNNLDGDNVGFSLRKRI